MMKKLIITTITIKDSDKEDCAVTVNIKVK